MCLKPEYITFVLYVMVVIVLSHAYSFYDMMLSLISNFITTKINGICALPCQLVETVKKAKEDLQNNEVLEEYKKKTSREIQDLSTALEESRASQDRMDKSKRKLQAEVGLSYHSFNLKYTFFLF